MNTVNVYSLSNYLVPSCLLTLQPPSDLNEKAEWRLLTSKAVRDSLKELIQKGEPVKRTINKSQFDRRGRRDERQLKVGGEEEGKDSDVDLESEDITETAAVTSSKHSKDGVGSVFVTSLSASAVGESRGRGLPRKIRKVSADVQILDLCLRF